jgi:hypothetical protein
LDADSYAIEDERNQRKYQLRYLRHRDKGKETSQELEEKEKRRQKEMEQQRVKEDLEFGSTQIQHVKHAIAAAQKRKSKKDTPPLKRLGGRTFKLWSLDHVKYCPEEAAPTRYIEFYSDDEWDSAKYDHPERKSKRLNRHVYLLSFTVCRLDYFTPPKHPILKMYTLKAGGGDWDLEIQLTDDDNLAIKWTKTWYFQK